MTSPLENTNMALEALMTSKFRTFLAVLGIIIGVAAVIMVASTSKSGKAVIFKELETFGLKTLWVFRSYQDDQPGKTTRQGTGIDNNDVETIARECDAVKRISPVISKWGWWAKCNNKYSKIRLVATTSDYIEINNDAVIKGRGLLPSDIKYRKNACLIGTEVADNLFSTEDPLGKDIRVGDYKYTVVGVLKIKDRDFLSSISAAGGMDENGRVVIPISLYQHQYNTQNVDYLQAETIHVSYAEKAAEQIKNVLQRRHKGTYQYGSQSMQQYIQTANNILRIVSWIGNIAAAISLLVGGIGIMNIMTASVVERTQEIGTRKALGARKTDIMMQFLTESVLIGFFGGAIGIVLAVGLIFLVEFLSNKPLLLASEYIIISLLVSVVIGVLSGIYPASRAASMDPVDALRSL
jgi:putative ABC transport system permease protein